MVPSNGSTIQRYSAARLPGRAHELSPFAGSSAEKGTVPFSLGRKLGRPASSSRQWSGKAPSTDRRTVSCEAKSAWVTRSAGPFSRTLTGRPILDSGPAGPYGLFANPHIVNHCVHYSSPRSGCLGRFIERVIVRTFGEWAGDADLSGLGYAEKFPLTQISRARQTMDTVANPGIISKRVRPLLCSGPAVSLCRERRGFFVGITLGRMPVSVGRSFCCVWSGRSRGCILHDEDAA